MEHKNKVAVKQYLYFIGNTEITFFWKLDMIFIKMSKSFGSRLHVFLVSPVLAGNTHENSSFNHIQQ